MGKYFKPKSLTWWASIAPLAAGVFVATAPMHGFYDVATSVTNATGLTAPVLINMGLAGVGLRGAL